MTLDTRLNAYRSDLADERLKGLIPAQRYAVGEPARVSVAVAQLRPVADLSRNIDSELLLGETVQVFEQKNGFAWVQSNVDGYVGYLPQSDLALPEETTHWIITPRTFIYPEAELRRYPAKALSMGSRIRVVGQGETRGTLYNILTDGGAVIASHCLPLSEVSDDDYVTVAARFLETPYLWGGRSGFGIDCSALVQLSLMMSGRSFPRDSDMQVKEGVAIERGDLRRGDLVFWKGHVGIMEDSDNLLHANGHTMSVARENFKAAVDRIGWLYGQPTGYRRVVA